MPNKHQYIIYYDSLEKQQFPFHQAGYIDMYFETSSKGQISAKVLLGGMTEVFMFFS